MTKKIRGPFGENDMTAGKSLQSQSLTFWSAHNVVTGAAAVAAMKVAVAAIGVVATASISGLFWYDLRHLRWRAEVNRWEEFTGPEAHKPSAPTPQWNLEFRRCKAT